LDFTPDDVFIFHIIMNHIVIVAVLVVDFRLRDVLANLELRGDAVLSGLSVWGSGVRNGLLAGLA
jgi:hypothetical protein